MEHVAGDIIDGRFTLREMIGAGAFGSVWRAVDQDDGTSVALKILHEKYLRTSRVRQRFAQEARLQHQLRHPSIARSIAWSVDLDHAYVAMEHIKGETLAQRLTDCSASARMIPLRGVAWLVDQLAAAIGHAHEHNVIHRDLKPANVMVNHPRSKPFLKVLDFGIAKVLVGSEVDPTTIGRVLGSILYLSPEQIRRDPVDPRSDIFSMGTIAYELLTLRRAWARNDAGEPLPFHEPVSNSNLNTQLAVLQRIVSDPRPSAALMRPEVPAAVDDVLARGMAVDPRDRFPTAGDFALAFRVALLEAPSMTNRSGSITPITDAIDTLTEHE